MRLQSLGGQAVVLQDMQSRPKGRLEGGGPPPSIGGAVGEALKAQAAAGADQSACPAAAPEVVRPPM
eukprot:541320-Karenia_brevis.AAC.1